MLGTLPAHGFGKRAKDLGGEPGGAAQAKPRGEVIFLSKSKTWRLRGAGAAQHREQRSGGHAGGKTLLGAEKLGLTDAEIMVLSLHPRPVGLGATQTLALREPQIESLTVSGVRVVTADGVFSPLFFHLQKRTPR